MIKEFRNVIHSLLDIKAEETKLYFPGMIDNLRKSYDWGDEILSNLNIAFLIMLAGEDYPEYHIAEKFLRDKKKDREWKKLADFYLHGVNQISNEITRIYETENEFKNRLTELSAYLKKTKIFEIRKIDPNFFWAVFFPEATGILEDRESAITQLRKKRTVILTEKKSDPISDPVNEILFTSNVLLTLPSSTKDISNSDISDFILKQISSILEESQLYWYDHPIQIGVDAASNELIYGLEDLNKAVEFEKKQGKIPEKSKMICLLSVSVTHEELHRIAKQYLKEEISKRNWSNNLNVYVFTEEDTNLVIEEVLLPAADQLLSEKLKKSDFSFFGVDGEYGRHYNFLKAIAAFWKVLINRDIKATFKIDLDQVFPQEKLVEETGLSALEHFKTSLWGAHGIDNRGQKVELGMIAGALVNQRDVINSLFTPDVRFPDMRLKPDELIFFSKLPQALSTEAEMMTRYNSNTLDGETRCLERIHVTGGTNGILIESLRRFRPFTPSFIGRAEDQAYILSVMNQSDTRLAYVHKDGLIMRHDKENFAQEAIKSAALGKLVGDYIRILYFSNYARIIGNNPNNVKELVDPFTGCFISKIPVTVVYLRFVLKAASLLKDGRTENGIKFLLEGSKRIRKALDFTSGTNSKMAAIYKKEKEGWNMYYDILDQLEKKVNENNSSALNLREKAQKIINNCRVSV